VGSPNPAPQGLARTPLDDRPERAPAADATDARRPVRSRDAGVPQQYER
jgi:hypothetical protein